jgi:hypothetical protein
MLFWEKFLYDLVTLFIEVRDLFVVDDDRVG